MQHNQLEQAWQFFSKVGLQNLAALNPRTSKFQPVRRHCEPAAMTSGVMVGRTVFVGLGLVTASIVLYTCLTDGSPFRAELLTPWMTATLVDFYINIVIFSIWLWYKEPAWGSRLIWTFLFFGFGSVTVSWYIALELFKLSPGDPVHLVLFRERRPRICVDSVAKSFVSLSLADLLEKKPYTMKPVVLVVVTAKG